jgi:hypothetical protein
MLDVQNTLLDSAAMIYYINKESFEAIKYIDRIDKSLGDLSGQEPLLEKLERLSEKQRNELGFTTPFEFAIYTELRSIVYDTSISYKELKSIVYDDTVTLKKATNYIYEMLKEENKIEGWKTNTSSEEKLSFAISKTLILKLEGFL